jgi:hypothetical protein
MTRNVGPRNRVWLSAVVLAVIALGLASRRIEGLFPAVLGKYPGDALWALTVFAGWAWVKPAASTRCLAGLALATSFVVEISQIYQAPWIKAVRDTVPGHLVLGSTFNWLDLVAYAIGVVIGAGLDFLWCRQRRS